MIIICLLLSVSYSAAQDVRSFFGINQSNPAVLVNSGEGEIENNPDHTPDYTTLIEEPEPQKPTILAYETDESATLGEQGITVLIHDSEQPEHPVLIAEPEPLPPTVIYMEPEFDPPSILYLDKETEHEQEEKINAVTRHLLTTRVIEEPEPDEVPTRSTAICFDREVIEIKQKCGKQIITEIIP